MINGKLVHLHGFTSAEAMLRFVPEWNVTRGEANEVMPGIMHGAIQEAEQRKAEDDMDERLKRFKSIERMIDEKNGKNSELLWSDQYRKIIRHMKEIHRPPDRILKAKSNQSPFTF